MGKRLDPEDPDTGIVWVSEQNAYRLLLGHELALVDMPNGERLQRLVPVYGSHVVWVDDAPDDDADGSGHFELHENDDEGYTAQRQAVNDG